MKSSIMVLWVLTALGCVSAVAQGTFNAASCSQIDVNAVINGPTHTAVNGDTINVPAGSCSWVNGITVPSNIGISIIGAGASRTIINDAISNGSQLIVARPTFGNSTMRISGFTFQPQSSSTNTGTPFGIFATCAAAGCPNIRIDNNVFASWSTSGNHLGAYALWWITNAFGVIDHNTITTAGGISNVVEFINANHAGYLGLGQLGDNSWASGPSFGTASALYIEDNTFQNGAFGTDCDHADTVYNTGGCRIVVRYNNFTGVLNGAAPVQNHGTESGGRLRSGYSMEVYGNQMTAAEAVAGFIGIRGGTARIWGNTIDLAGFGASNLANLSLYRHNNGDSHFAPWYYCDGTGSWDQNDGVVYASGTYTGGSGSTQFVDSTKSWTNHQWQSIGSPYSIRNTTQGYGYEITDSNASGQLFGTSPFIDWGNQGAGFRTWNSGDSYQILRAKVCIDQPGRAGPSNLLSGNTPGQTGWVGEQLVPIYEWSDGKAGSSNFNQGIVTADSLRVIRNRDFYNENQNQGAQTSPSSPFDGTPTIGMGHGTLANRPSTCTTGVGYWATDSGPNWNNGTSNGQLFTCAAPNTWAVYYTPYTYPHPLVSGSSAAPPPIPPVITLAAPGSVVAASH